MVFLSGNVIGREYAGKYIYGFLVFKELCSACGVSLSRLFGCIGSGWQEKIQGYFFHAKNPAGGRVSSDTVCVYDFKSDRCGGKRIFFFLFSKRDYRYFSDSLYGGHP